MKEKSETPKSKESYVLKYDQWTSLRLTLYQTVIDENLSYMDTSVPYPSGTHTLMIQMGRSDQLRIIVTATKGIDTVNVGIYCDEQCLDSSKLQHKITMIMENLSDSSQL